jgi:hypothetical protein
MARTNANHPDLSFRVTGFESIASSDFTSIDFKGSGFEIDRYDLAMITFFDLRWRSLPEVIESVTHRFHHLAGQILLCYIGVVVLPYS